MLFAFTSFRSCSPHGGMSCSLQEVGKQLLSPSLSLGYFHLLLNFVEICSVFCQGCLNERGYVPYSLLSSLSTVLWLPGCRGDLCESLHCLPEDRSAQLLNSQCMNIKKATYGPILFPTPSSEFKYLDVYEITSSTYQESNAERKIFVN